MFHHVRAWLRHSKQKILGLLTDLKRVIDLESSFDNENYCKLKLNPSLPVCRREMVKKKRKKKRTLSFAKP